MFVAIAANAWTVYFDASKDSRTSGWTAVNIHAWNGGTATTGNWPGKAMTKLDNGLWSYTQAGAAPANVIFNKAAGTGSTTQTGNLVFEEGATYDFSGIIGAQTYDHVVYFENANNWSNVYVYAWGAFNDGSIPSYPGLELKPNEQGLFVWKITNQDPNAPTGKLTNDGFLFNNNADNMKTPDLDNYVEGATYLPSGAIKGQEEVPATPQAQWYYNISGTFNDWASNNGQQPGEELSNLTWEGLKLGTKQNSGDTNPTGEFEVKVWDGADKYFGNTQGFKLGEWVDLYENGGHMAVGADENAEYKVTINVKDNKILVEKIEVVEYPEEMFVYFTGKTGWNNEKGLSMNNDGDGQYTVENVEIYPEGGQYGYVTFSEVGEGGWDALNAKRYGPAEDGTEATGDEMPYEKSNNAWKILPGVYTVYFLADEEVVVFEKTGDVNLAKKLYILGHVNDRDFQPNKGIAVEADENDVYTFKDIAIAGIDDKDGMGEFTFAPALASQDGDEGWKELETIGQYGPADNNTVIKVGDTQKVEFFQGVEAKGSHNWNIAGGIYNITVDLKNNTLEIVSETHPDQFYLRGAFNEWGTDENILRPAYKDAETEKTEKGELVYYAHLDKLDGEFKLAFGDWAVNYGGGLEFGVNNIQELEAYGGNIKADNLEDVTLLFYYNPAGTSRLVAVHLPNEVRVVKYEEKKEGTETLSTLATDNMVGTLTGTVLTLQNEVPDAQGIFYYEGRIKDYIAGQFLLEGDKDGVKHGSDDDGTQIGTNGKPESLTGDFGATLGNGYFTTGQMMLTDGNLKFAYNPDNTTPSILTIDNVTTGIEDVTVEAADSDATYYNLQGVRVVNPVKGGIYVRVQGTTATKVIIK